MNKKIISKFFFIYFIILTFVIVFAASSCTAVKNILESQTSASTQQVGPEEATGSTSQEAWESIVSEGGTESTGSEGSITKNKLIYYEVTSDEKSNHFEHRVANVYTVNVDSSDKKLIYSDISDKYDFGPAYNVSPDGKKVACQLNEGGRGAYTALCVLDTVEGKLKTIYEIDNTKEELQEFYGVPVWSSDSRYLAFELINPFPNNYRDKGIFIADVVTGEVKEVVLDVGGQSLRSTMFMIPVYFFENNAKMAAAFHPYNIIKKSDDLVDIYWFNESLYYFSVGGGEVTQMFDISVFKEGGPEIITSFDNFRYVEKADKIVFQVLGDFEEDGDLWISNSKGSDIKKLTGDTSLREQQPDIYEEDGKTPLVVYIGVQRYGTISSQIPSGDVYIIDIDGSNKKKLTDYGVGVSKPFFSPDGAQIAYLNSIYDENFENIIKNRIEAVEIASGNVSIAVENGFVYLIGWTK